MDKPGHFSIIPEFDADIISENLKNSLNDIIISDDEQIKRRVTSLQKAYKLLKNRKGYNFNRLVFKNNTDDTIYYTYKRKNKTIYKTIEDVIKDSDKRKEAYRKKKENRRKQTKPYYNTDLISDTDIKERFKNIFGIQKWKEFIEYMEDEKKFSFYDSYIQYNKAGVAVWSPKGGQNKAYMRDSAVFLVSDHIKRGNNGRIIKRILKGKKIRTEISLLFMRILNGRNILTFDNLLYHVMKFSYNYVSIVRTGLSAYKVYKACESLYMKYCRTGEIGIPEHGSANKEHHRIFYYRDKNSKEAQEYVKEYKKSKQERNIEAKVQILQNVIIYCREYSLPLTWQNIAYEYSRQTNRVKDGKVQPISFPTYQRLYKRLYERHNRLTPSDEDREKYRKEYEERISYIENVKIYTKEGQAWHNPTADPDFKNPMTEKKKQDDMDTAKAIYEAKISAGTTDISTERKQQERSRWHSILRNDMTLTYKRFIEEYPEYKETVSENLFKHTKTKLKKI